MIDSYTIANLTSAVKQVTRIFLADTENYVPTIKTKVTFRMFIAKVKPVSSDHVNQDILSLFRQVVAYCCMKVVQKAPQLLLSFCNKHTPVYSDFHVT